MRLFRRKKPKRYVRNKNGRLFNWAQREKSDLAVEFLEPRLLLASNNPTAEGAFSESIYHHANVPTLDDTATEGVREIVVVDPSVTEYQILTDEIQSDSDTSIFMLESNSDGIAQISNILKQYDEIEAIHILSHGSIGSFHLAGSRIDQEALLGSATALQSWGESLKSGADMLLYGCNVGAGIVGAEFVETLSELIGADVAASSDVTGSSDQGGNWVLENSTGPINTSPLSNLYYSYLLEAIEGTNDSDILTSNAGEDDTLMGGAGDDRYVFGDNWGIDAVVELEGEGEDTLDFSAVTTDLAFTIHADGKVSVTDGANLVSNVSNIENLIGGSGNNTFEFEGGGAGRHYRRC
ncbi:MAG: hypothetical protein AMJ79_03730 [Phycisphaerae bacterium SM23_30]|nr:MAG: hypothetical protein AMJ79_03730 [Phycisphaerae bacterium SM23_30]